MENHSTKYRPDIDGLRTIAVCAVVLFHAFPRSLPGGFAGVDIFFVISGYLISSILFSNFEKGRFTLKDFFSRRIKRIFPALLLVFLTTYIFSYFNLFPHAFGQLGKHILGGSTFSSNFFLWSESGYFDVSAESKPLLHLWSLAIEEQFYILWPLTLMIVWRKKSLVLPVILFAILISFLLNIFYLNQYPSAVFYFPFFRFWEILIGTLLAYLTIYHPQNFFVKDDINSSNFRATLGFVLLGLGVGFLNHKKAFPGWWALLPVIGTVLLISGGERAWINRKILARKHMVAIGLISYPLYLWHWPILVFLRIRFDSDPSVILRTLAVVLSFTFAILTYKLLEKPFKNQKLLKRPNLSLILTMISFGILGFYTFKMKGFPERWPEEIREIANIDEPYEYFNFLSNTRTGVCHTRPRNVSLDLSIKNCTEKANPLVFLMGDSYAASLYPGLKAIQNKPQKFGIAQFTNGNAPPFLNLPLDKVADNRIPVSKLNLENIQIIRQLQPEYVLIGWRFNQGNGLKLKPSVQELLKTIETIQAQNSSTKVIVMGPTPEWEDHLYIVYLEYWLEKSKVLPLYSNFRLKQDFIKWDLALDAALQIPNVTYISARKILCKNDQCLTRVGNNTKDLTVVDYGHLSSSASTFLLERTLSDYLK